MIVGLGIGLTLVKALVQMHGGEITAESAGLGHGTTMTIRVPLLAARQAHAAAPAVDVSPDKQPCRVLVIDDNEDGREMLRLLCELYGHAVIEAADGPDGIERAVSERPDIAFVDIGLPTLDGYEVARQVRARIGNTTRLVALSGYGSPEHRAQALSAGFDEHIAKPINATQLQRVFSPPPRPRRQTDSA